jgi:hypothetical protein
MKQILPWLGPLVFLGLVVNFACQYGQQWRFGRYGMPSSLLSPDGRTYIDGKTEVDPVTLAMARSGKEEECYLGALLVLIILAALVVREMRGLYRMQMKEVDRELRRIHGLPPDDERK